MNMDITVVMMGMSVAGSSKFNVWLLSDEFALQIAISLKSTRMGTD